jgi:anti-anti-sigma factor
MRKVTTMNVTGAFDVERVGTVLVLNLRRGMQDLDLTELTTILERLRVSRGTDVIVDCHDIDFLRSLALGFFVTVSKRVKRGGGHMVFCNVSEKARQILRATKLDQVWHICDSRDAAMAATVCQKQ